MPFNLLLLPLLAGYLYLAKSNVRSYSTSLLQKEQLLLAAASYGLVFLIISRLVVLGLLSTHFGCAWAQWFHHFAPFDYSGTSLGTVLIAFAAWNASNLFVSEQAAGFWLYNRRDFDSLTRVFWQSTIGVRPTHVSSGFVLTLRLTYQVTVRWLQTILRMRARFWLRHSLKAFITARENGVSLAGFASGTPRPVMLHLKDSKVIVGLIVDLPANRPAADFVTILPLWTGHRDEKTKRLFKAVDYEAALTRVNDPYDLSRVIRTADIASAAIWSDSAFEPPPAPPVQQPPQSWAGRDGIEL